MALFQRSHPRRAVEESRLSALLGVWLDIPAIINEEIARDKHVPVYPSRQQNANATMPRKWQLLNNIDGGTRCSRIGVRLTDHRLRTTIVQDFLHVRGQDPLRDEDLIYERVLRERGTSTMLKVCSGISYGTLSFFHGISPATEYSKDVIDSVAWGLGVPVPKLSANC